MRKRFLMTIALIISTLMVLVVFIGCNSTPNNVDKPDNTEASPTDAAGSATPEGTDNPVVPTQDTSADTDYYATGMKLEVGTPIEADIDFDGIQDTVAVTVARAGQYDSDFLITITLGKAVENPYSYKFEYAYDMDFGIIADFDASDSRLDVVVSYMQDDGDGSILAYRVNSEGSGIDSHIIYGNVTSIQGKEYIDGILHVEQITSILGTFGLVAEYRLTDKGFEAASEKSYYCNTREVTVASEFVVYAVNEGTEERHEMTVLPGSTVTPVETDRETYVLVTLSTGEAAYINITVDEYDVVLINGQQQDFLLDVMYAG